MVLTLLISGAYRRIRRTVAVQVALGLMMLVAGSWLANHLGLVLTSYLLSTVGAVATIAILVLFQPELRRALSRLSPARWLMRRRANDLLLDTSTIIAEAAFWLARRKKGALIVIPRRDPVLDHVTAGIAVEARVSAPLIEAIFTSTSPLHDGAIVLEEDRLLRAGVVLPLATESADPKHGTRHRAALGLARATDGLVVCVSEEYGSVSLAHDDVLEPITDDAQLRGALHRLGQGGARRERKGLASRRARLASLLPHLGIFAAVVAAWAALGLARSHATTRIVPLDIRNLADGIVVDPQRQTSVAVEVRGSRRELDLLSSDAVEAYVDLNGAKLGVHAYRVHANAPPGIEITSYAPASVPLVISARPRPAAGPRPRRRGGRKRGDGRGGTALPRGTRRRSSWSCMRFMRRGGGHRQGRPAVRAGLPGAQPLGYGFSFRHGTRAVMARPAAIPSDTSTQRSAPTSQAACFRVMSVTMAKVTPAKRYAP